LSGNYQERYAKHLLCFFKCFFFTPIPSLGLALIPQAGVALGMGLIAIQRRPDLGEIILPVAIASTIVFELIGPIFTRIGLGLAGEINKK